MAAIGIALKHGASSLVNTTPRSLLQHVPLAFFAKYVFQIPLLSKYLYFKEYFRTCFG